MHAEEFSVTEMMLWSQKKTALFWLPEVNYKLTINWKVSLKPKKISISRESKYNKESCIGPVNYYWISPNYFCSFGGFCPIFFGSLCPIFLYFWTPKALDTLQLACSKHSDSGERCEVMKAMKLGLHGERGAGTLVRIFNKSVFRYTRSWYTLWLVDFDSFCQQWSVFDHSEKCDMAMMTDSTFRPEFELATNTELSDFPNVESKGTV